MAEKRFTRPDVLSRPSMQVTTSWSDVFELDKLDDLYLAVATYPVYLRLSPKLEPRVYEWREPLYLEAGAQHSWTDGILGEFGAFQLQAIGGTATVTVKAICRGGAA